MFPWLYGGSQNALRLRGQDSGVVCLREAAISRTHTLTYVQVHVHHVSFLYFYCLKRILS